MVILAHKNYASVAIQGLSPKQDKTKKQTKPPGRKVYFVSKLTTVSATHYLSRHVQTTGPMKKASKTPMLKSKKKQIKTLPLGKPLAQPRLFQNYSQPKKQNKPPLPLKAKALHHEPSHSLEWEAEAMSDEALANMFFESEQDDLAHLPEKLPSGELRNQADDRGCLDLHHEIPPLRSSYPLDTQSQLASQLIRDFVKAELVWQKR